MIVSPDGDVTIVVGDTVELVGDGVDPNGLPLEFNWDIDGGAGNSTAQSPGNTTFNMEGVWDVELTVTNSDGIADPSPAKIKVTVIPDSPL
jgi:PKD repeat protein